MLPGRGSFVVNHFCYQTSKSLPSLCLARYYSVVIGKRVHWLRIIITVISRGGHTVYVAWTSTRPRDTFATLFLCQIVTWHVTIWQRKRVANVSLGQVEVHATYTMCPPLDITVIIILIYLIFFLFWRPKFFLWRPFYNWRSPKGDFLKKWAWSAGTHGTARAKWLMSTRELSI